MGGGSSSTREQGRQTCHAVRAAEDMQQVSSLLVDRSDKCISASLSSCPCVRLTNSSGAERGGTAVRAAVAWRLRA